MPSTSEGREYKGVNVAVDMMKKLLKENSSKLMDGYTLTIKTAVAQCKPDIVVRNILQYYSERSKLIGVIGPCKLSISIKKTNQHSNFF